MLSTRQQKDAKRMIYAGDPNKQSNKDLNMLDPTLTIKSGGQYIEQVQQ